MSVPPDGTNDTPQAGGAESVGDGPSDQGAEQPDREPGWYPDPDGSGWRRYWDGTAWATASAEELARAEPKQRDAERPAPDRQRNLIAGLVAVIVVVIIAVVIIAAAGSSKKTNHAASSGASTTARTLTSLTTTATSTATTTTPALLTAAAVTQAVNAYVAAYNARSTRALRRLFSPSLIRRSDDGAPQNLARAMAVYRGQFSAEATPDLVLAGLRVTPGAGQATAGAYFGVYAHNRRTRGKIAFHFVPSGSGLRIDELNIHARS